MSAIRHMFPKCMSTDEDGDWGSVFPLSSLPLPVFCQVLQHLPIKDKGNLRCVSNW